MEGLEQGSDMISLNILAGPLDCRVEKDSRRAGTEAGDGPGHHGGNPTRGGSGSGGMAALGAVRRGEIRALS